MGLRNALVPAQLVGEQDIGSEETGCSDGTGNVHHVTRLLAVTGGLSSDMLGSHGYLACPAKVQFLATTFCGQFVLPLIEFLCFKENITKEYCFSLSRQGGWWSTHKCLMNTA